MIRDLIDIITLLKDEVPYDSINQSGKRLRNTVTFRNNSISFKSRDSILTVNSALENLYMTYLQAAVEQTEIIDLDKGESKQSFIKGIHQNDYDYYGLDNPLALKDTDTFGKTLESLNKPYAENFNMTSISGYNVFEEETKEEKEKKAKENLDKLIPPNKLSPSDSKKLNGLQPVPITLKVGYKVNNAGIKDTEINLYMKCITHPLSFKDVVDYIPRSIKTENILFRAIQWTTGEISFWKDFILNIDDIKHDASRRNEPARWWVHLKNKSKVAKLKSAFNKDRFIPNATMVFNIEEMNYIKSHSGIDLMGKDSKKVISLYETYFLLGVVVVDEINEMVYMYDDIVFTWNMYPLKSLNKAAPSASKNIIELKLS